MPALRRSFTGRGSSPDFRRETVVFTDVATVCEALGVNVEQGEGTANSPQEMMGADFAHYHRFMQVKKGRALVKLPGKLPPDQQYSHPGDAVPFDASGVYPVPTNSRVANYGKDSAERFACDNLITPTRVSCACSTIRSTAARPDSIQPSI